MSETNKEEKLNILRQQRQQEVWQKQYDYQRNLLVKQCRYSYKNLKQNQVVGIQFPCYSRPHKKLQWGVVRLMGNEIYIFGHNFDFKVIDDVMSLDEEDGGFLQTHNELFTTSIENSKRLRYIGYVYMNQIKSIDLTTVNPKNIEPYLKMSKSKLYRLLREQDVVYGFNVQKIIDLKAALLQII